MEGCEHQAGGRWMYAWRGRVAQLALIATATILVMAAPAAADGTGDAWTDGASVGAGASAGVNYSPGSQGGGSSPSTCEWHRLDPEHAAVADRMAENGTGESRSDGPGAWYRKICNGSRGNLATVVWVPDRVDPRVLAEQAADRVPIPDVKLEMNPTPKDGAVVNLATWLWIDPSSWATVAAQASAGNVVVTATASPQRVVWDMGNGDRVTCEGPGTPYDPSRPSTEQSSDCSYTYRKSSARAEGGAYTVTATVVWEVSWTVTGAAGGGSLGTAPRSQSIRLPVKEIQAVNR